MPPLLEEKLKAKNPKYKILIASGYPVDYILEQVQILGLEFKLDESVLIPRPETEWLIDSLNKYIHGEIILEFKLVNKRLEFLRLKENRNLILDLGTGSGLIALGMSGTFKKIIAVDKFEAALKTAKLNTALNKIKNLEFYQSDLLNNPQLKQKLLMHPGFILIANLPYVPTTDLENAKINKINFEPKTSIYSGLDGLGHFRRVLSQLKTLNLNPSLLIFELDPRNIQKAQKLGQKQFSWVEIVDDCFGVQRFMFCTTI